MKTKIFGMLVCMLVFTAALPAVAGTMNEIQDNFDKDIKDNFEQTVEKKLDDYSSDDSDTILIDGYEGADKDSDKEKPGKDGDIKEDPSPGDIKDDTFPTTEDEDKEMELNFPPATEDEEEIKLKLIKGEKVTVPGTSKELILEDIDNSGAVVILVESGMAKLYPGESETICGLTVSVIESSYNEDYAVLLIKIV